LARGGPARPLSLGKGLIRYPVALATCFSQPSSLVDHDTRRYHMISQQPKIRRGALPTPTLTPTPTPTSTSTSTSTTYQHRLRHRHFLSLSSPDRHHPKSHPAPTLPLLTPISHSPFRLNGFRSSCITRIWSHLPLTCKSFVTPKPDDNPVIGHPTRGHSSPSLPLRCPAQAPTYPSSSFANPNPPSPIPHHNPLSSEGPETRA